MSMRLEVQVKHMAINAPNKSLKHVQRFALHWTVLTGAASHCRAGSACRLAPR